MQPIVMTYGTERSRLPTMITSVWPMATRPRVLGEHEDRLDVAGGEEVAVLRRRR